MAGATTVKKKSLLPSGLFALHTYSQCRRPMSVLEVGKKETRAPRGGYGDAEACSDENDRRMAAFCGSVSPIVAFTRKDWI